MGDLDGHIAFVTGAGSGLGLEIARVFARAGARVAVNDLRPGPAAAVQAELAAMGAAGPGPYVGDVADPAAVRSWFTALGAATGGRLDVLVNNAGYADMDPETTARMQRQIDELTTTGRATTALETTARLSDERWTRMLAVHLTGTFNCTREALALMAPRQSGRIVNMASIAGTTGIAGAAHYSAAKGGIIGFTRAVAREVGMQGILVNAIAPGYIDTPLLDVLGERRDVQSAAIAQQTVLGRLGEAREIAATALFLAGPGASYFTGQVLSPNGGLWDLTPPLIAGLLDPRVHPHRPRRVELVQTHISWVLLAGARVYKLHKAVRLAFVDFSTAAARRRDCEAEVRLNRRFAPGVYLGVVRIGWRGGRVVIGVGSPGEAAVVMRRLPAGRQLARLLARGRVTRALADRLGRHLARLHAGAPRGAGVARHGGPSAIARLWRDDVRLLGRARGRTLTAAELGRLEDAGARFLARERTLLRRRQRRGFIRDVHGDLHAEHVYLLGPRRRIVLVDCLEFSERLRCCDVVSDLAFLSMDLERRGADTLARRIEAAYARAARDPDLPRLLPFYRCHRAMVRAGVDALLAAEREVPRADRRAALVRSRAYVRLALRDAWALGAPVVVVCAGLSGSGKSSVARALAAESGWTHLASDPIRKRLAGLRPEASGATRPRLYSVAMTDRTYAALFAGAERELARGRSVLLDATFLRPEDRRALAALAVRRRVRVLLLVCHAPDAVVRRRLRGRQPLTAHGSDADEAIYLAQRRAGVRWEVSPPVERALLATGAPSSAMAARAAAAVWRWYGLTDRRRASRRGARRG